MPDVGGHVISREFSKDAQLYNMHAVCNFTGKSMDNAALSWHFFTPCHHDFFTNSKAKTCLNIKANLIKVISLINTKNINELTAFWKKQGKNSG